MCSNDHSFILDRIETLVSQLLEAQQISATASYDSGRIYEKHRREEEARKILENNLALQTLRSDPVHPHNRASKRKLVWRKSQKKKKI